MKPQPDFTWDELRRLREAHRQARLFRNAEGFTFEEYARQFGISIRQAHREIAALIEEGKVRFAGLRTVGFDSRGRPNRTRKVFQIVR